MLILVLALSAGVWGGFHWEGFFRSFFNLNQLWNKDKGLYLSLRPFQQTVYFFSYFLKGFVPVAYLQSQQQGDYLIWILGIVFIAHYYSPFFHKKKDQFQWMMLGVLTGMSVGYLLAFVVMSQIFNRWLRDERWSIALALAVMAVFFGLLMQPFYVVGVLLVLSIGTVILYSKSMLSKVE